MAWVRVTFLCDAFISTHTLPPLAYLAVWCVYYLRSICYLLWCAKVVLAGRLCIRARLRTWILHLFAVHMPGIHAVLGSYLLCVVLLGSGISRGIFGQEWKTFHHLVPNKGRVLFVFGGRFALAGEASIGGGARLMNNAVFFCPHRILSRP